MTTLNWQSEPQAPTVTAANPWFAISLGLFGLIIGFGLNRFTPHSLGAQVLQQPTAQAIVVQTSPTKPLPSAGGCGCGGGGGKACGGALAPIPVPNS